jgi:crossover junction endodeoxyribonuclease RuvC
LTDTALRHRGIGIDPGSRSTGYGIIDSDGRHSRRVASGCIRVGEQPWPDRLGSIYDRVAALVAEHRPHELAVEQLIFARDATAALKLGQARGAILCAGLKAGLMVHEYSPSRSSWPWSAPAARTSPRSAYGAGAAGDAKRHRRG